MAEEQPSGLNDELSVRTFHSVATDPLGFRQPAPGGAQAATLLLPPPPPPPEPVRAFIVTQRVGKKKHPRTQLAAEVLFSSGRPPEFLVSPFQKPAYQGVQAALRDLDGDGVFDAVLFTAHRGRKKFSRVVRV